MTTKIDYKAWALDMCALLDAIEAAVVAGDQPRARRLIQGRFKMAEKHGMTVKMAGFAGSGETH